MQTNISVKRKIERK